MRFPLIFSLSSSSLPCISLKTLLLVAVACLLGGSGLTAAAQATVSPTSVSWSKVAIGQAGGQKVVTLTNTGSSTITINSIGFTGTDASDFEVFSKTCGSTLAAPASCTANIIFKPTTTGTLTATLNFTDSASGSPQQVSLTGLGTSASVTASPTSLSFGSVSTGSTSAAQTVTVTNGSTSSVTLSGAGITGTNAADFAVSSTTCGSSLAASASCTASVDFKPSASGSFTASWSVTAGSSALAVVLSGTGTSSSGGPVSASPTSLTWGNVEFGNTGGAKTVTLTNSGSSAISFSGITFTGSDPNDFYATNTCGTSVAASGSCTASVFFRPTTAGTRTAILDFNDSASNSPQTVALSGTGTSNTSGSVTTSPSSLNFGSVDVGSSSSTMTAALYNETASSITISSVSIIGSDAGDYSISSNGCGSTLNSSASCSVSMTFKPTTGGTRAATLTFTDSASNSPQVVSLTGSGVSSSSGTATASPNPTNFGSFPVNTASGTKVVTLKNNGTTFFSMKSISIPNTNDFYETTQSCGTGLAPSATCTISLIFDPTTTGTRTATLTISDGASNSPQTVTLMGTGTPAPTTSLAISPGSSSWGSQTVGTTVNKTFTLTAGGSGSLTINSITTVGVNGATGGSGDFKIVSNTCPSTLAAGSAPCNVTVSFNPSAIGNRVALLSVADTGIASPQTAEVSGNGAYTAAQCSGSGSCAITVDFGSRSGSQVPIAANILGSEYIESLPSNANRTTVLQGGFTAARYRTQMQTIFPSSPNAPSWGLLDHDITELQTEGVKVIIMEVENSPTFLQPTPLICGSAPETSQPTSSGSLSSGAQEWGQIVAQLVQHMDTKFPNLARYYEIWNEPNSAALCGSFAGETSAEKASDYLNIYAAAAPMIKNQWTTDHSLNSALLPVFKGGPATAGVDGNYTPLVTNSSTAPNVDFYSYHLYVGSSTNIKNGMTWDTATTSTTPELYQMETNTSTGIGARFLQAYKIVAASTLTPLKAKTPIFYDEYNDDFAFEPDCCRNHPLYGPLYNSVAVEQVLNQVYKGAGQVPSNMTYFAADQVTFCILGIIDSAMDCSKAATGAQAQPYPQWYTYQLIFTPSYLDLQDGGHMATSVTLSSGASSSGLLATAFYTASTDSILIINSSNSSFTGVTLQINNSGLASPTSTLYALNAECTSSADPQTCAFAPNAYISSWPATTISASGGIQATFDVPAHSVLAISLKN